MGELTKAIERVGLDMRVAALVSHGFCILSLKSKLRLTVRDCGIKYKYPGLT